MDWFRAHHGITSDSKWPIIAKISGQKIGDVVAVWIALLEHASQSDDRGHILGFDTETIDVLYGYEDGTTESIVNALKKKGMIFDDWITNWGKRQPDRERDDDSAERVKRFRERQKQQIQSNQCNTETTQSCNANVTLHVTDVTDVTPCNAQNREEQNRKESIETCAELSACAHSTPNAAQAPLEPDKKKSYSKKSSTPFPDGFVITPAIAEWTRQKIPDCDINSEFEAFSDHHVSHGNRFVDWNAAWRTWIQRKLQFHTRAPAQKSAPVAKEKPVEHTPEQVFQKPENQPEEWVNALNSIRKTVGNQCFNTWFDPVACHGIRDGTLELTVPTESFRTCLIENYKPLLLKATGAKEISVRQWKAS